MKRTQAPINTVEGDLKVVAILVLIPLANVQVANQVLAGHAMPSSHGEEVKGVTIPLPESR